MVLKATGVYARVRLTVELPVPSHWAPGVQLEQVYSQAVEDALGKLRKACDGSSVYRIIGEPVVTAVMVDSTKAEKC